MSSAIIVADVSVLLNFIKIERTDLMSRCSRRFLATDHVENEIDDATQRTRFIKAVAAGHLDTCSVSDPREVALFIRLAASHRLVPGECCAIAVAVNRGHALAMEDKRALSCAFRTINATSGTIEVVRTVDIVVELIQAGALTVEEADRMKEDWARHHGFHIKAITFDDLL